MKTILFEVKMIPIVKVNQVFEQIDKAISKWRKNKYLSFDKMVSIFQHYVRDYNSIFQIGNKILQDNCPKLGEEFYYKYNQITKHLKNKKNFKIVIDNHEVNRLTLLDDKNYRIINDNNHDIQIQSRSKLFDCINEFLYKTHNLDELKKSILEIESNYHKTFIPFCRSISIEAENEAELKAATNYFYNAYFI